MHDGLQDGRETIYISVSGLRVGVLEDRSRLGWISTGSPASKTLHSSCSLKEKLDHRRRLLSLKEVRSISCTKYVQVEHAIY